MSGNGNVDEQLLNDFNATLHHGSQALHDIYTSAEMPIIAVGIFGHLLSLLTLFVSRNTQTPSFLYHKALTTAELCYCANCVVVKVIDDVHPNVYGSYAAAFYVFTMQRLITSTTGYVILYMTLFIAVDRFVAINFGPYYRKVNLRRFAIVSISTSIVVSGVLNSWSPAFEMVIAWSPNRTVYRVHSRLGPRVYVSLAKATDIYNRGIRIAYPFLLAILTFAVVFGFVAQKRRREQMTHGQCSMLHRPSQLAGIATAQRNQRREGNLLKLLVLIVLVSFLQVIPAESQRILKWVYPAEVAERLMVDSTSTYEDRRSAMLVYYAHAWLRMIANLCTFLNRSCSFYLYFVFNGAFRAEVLKIFRGCSRFVLCKGNHGSGGSKETTVVVRKLDENTKQANETMV